MQLRHSMVQCFVVRGAGASAEFLQLRRAAGRYMGGTWQLVSGGIEDGETAWAAALREVREETGLAPAEFYQLDVVNTFYLAKDDSVWVVPVFCAVVDASAAVSLNAEHTDHRWLRRADIAAALMWPGERQALAELCREILDDGPAKPHLCLNHLVGL